MEATKPAEVRGQTQDEIRMRLKKQGKLKNVRKDEDNGVSELTDDQARIKMAERNERLTKEATKKDPLVRQLNKKDIALRMAAEKSREDQKDGGKPEVLTQDKIDSRNHDDDESETETEIEENPGDVTEEVEEPAPEETGESVSEEDKTDSEPPEIFAKDIVSFKEEDGTIVTGKVLKVNAKGEATIDTEEATYTVSCNELTKEEK